jgi:hypothetical protein
LLRTAAGIVPAGQVPAFVDVDKETMGMSPDSLRDFLVTKTITKDGKVVNKETGNTIRAVVPVHIFGHPVRINEIKAICDEYNLMLIEDAAEALGSYRDGKHVGTFGLASILSFNGNKTVTTGGGGMVLRIMKQLLRDTVYSADQQNMHPWEFVHEAEDYNSDAKRECRDGFASALRFLTTIRGGGGDIIPSGQNKREELGCILPTFFASSHFQLSRNAGCLLQLWPNVIKLNSLPRT